MKFPAWKGRFQDNSFLPVNQEGNRPCIPSNIEDKILLVLPARIIKNVKNLTT